jgi:hypothetical protein
VIMTVVTVLPKRPHQIVVEQIATLERRTGLTAVFILAMFGYGLWRIVSILRGAPNAW